MLLKLTSQITLFVSDPHQGKVLALFSPIIDVAYVELRVGVERHACFASVAKSKIRSKQKRVIQSDQDVQVCGFFLLAEGG